MRNLRQGRGSRVTISDVGAAAGVSASTVSRVLNGTTKVDPALAARVHDAVTQLGYRPNAAAQGLARGEWGTIGVLVPDLANPYFPGVLKAVSAVARSHGRRVMVMESDDDPSIEQDLVEDLMRSCDGVLLASSRMERADLAVLTGRDHPLVLLNRIVPGLAAPAVSADFFGGMMLICGHLAQLGHRRVAYLSGPEVSWANSERIRALEAAKAFGLSVTILPCGSTSRCGYEAAAAVAGTGATALTTYNDLVALGAVTRMRELGVRVPEELSVVGFDDIALDHVAHTGLTTVSVPQGQLGRQAAEMLVALMTEGHDGAPVTLPMELQVRDSTAPPGVPAVLTGEGDGVLTSEGGGGKPSSG